MLRKIVTMVLAAGFAAVMPHAASAVDNTDKVHAEAVPLNESAGAAEVTAADKGGGMEGAADESNRPPRMAPAEARGAGVHVVIQGDTLWDLSGRFLDNPFMWTEVWKVNPHIDNPNLIYPGDEVVLPGVSPGMAGATKPVTSMALKAEKAKAEATDRNMYDQTFAQEEPFVDMGKTVLRLDGDEGPRVISLDKEKHEKIAVSNLEEILSAGYLDIEPLPYEWTHPHETKRLYYTFGDEILVWMSPDLEVGDYLITAKDEGEVEHPTESFCDLGEMIQPTGMVRITGTGGDFYVAEVVMALSEITEENLLLKFEDPKIVYEPVPRNPRLKGKWGYVVSSKWRKILSEQSHYVYLDLGSDDGVKPGDVFEVWREEPSEIKYIYEDDNGKRKTKAIFYERPETFIGKVQVIYVQDGTSTARATLTDEPIEVGHRVYYKD